MNRIVSSTPIHVRTPLFESVHLGKYLPSSMTARVFLKLENTQPSGSFKLRGVGHRCSKAAKEEGAKNFVCSSGGNAGLAVAYTARQLGLSSTIFLPESSPPSIQERLHTEGAKVHVAGSVWNEADEAARAFAAQSTDYAYIPPFDHPDIWTGHATIVEELKDQLPEQPDLIIVSVGGGGFFNGVCEGLEKVGWEKTTVLAMETDGANCFQEAIRAGKPVVIPGITSVAKSLGSVIVSSESLKWYHKLQVESATVSDEEAIDACLRFANDHKFMVEPACGASLAPVYSGLLSSNFSEQKLQDMRSIVVLVCGGSVTDIPFAQK